MVAILPRSAPRAGGDNRTMIRYVVDVAATRRHSFSVELRIERPAAAQRLSLPVWIPGSYLVREFARHLSALSARAGRARRAARAARQGDLAGARASGRAPLVVQLPRLCLRHLGARRLSRRLARLLQRHQPVPARRGARGRAARARARAACPPAGRSRPRCAGRGRRRRTRLRGRRLRRAGRPPGRARPLLARRASRPPACRTSSSSPARCPTSTASACSPTRSASARREIAFWHGSGASRRSSATCSCSTRVDDGYGGLEHRASTALIAARRDLPRGAARSRRRPSDGYVDAARPDQPRVLPRLERQAAEAGASSRATTTRARTTPSCSGSSRASPPTTTTCCCCAPA